MERDRVPFDAYLAKRHKPKQERQCLFYNRLGIEPDPNPCFGKHTDHHVLYRSEFGTDDMNNIVDLCEGHQHFAHKTNEWGDEDFDDLIPKGRR